MSIFGERPDGEGGRAATLNALVDERNNQRRGEPIEQAKIARYGTADWLFRQYRAEHIGQAARLN